MNIGRKKSGFKILTCMEIEKVIDLLQELQDSKFWGSLEMSFRDGSIQRIKVGQTILNDSHDVNIVMIRQEETNIVE